MLVLAASEGCFCTANSSVQSSQHAPQASACAAVCREKKSGVFSASRSKSKRKMRPPEASNTGDAQPQQPVAHATLAAAAAAVGVVVSRVLGAMVGLPFDFS
jgi:hypothetical protein